MLKLQSPNPLLERVINVIRSEFESGRLTAE